MHCIRNLSFFVLCYAIMYVEQLINVWVYVNLRLSFRLITAELSFNYV